MSKSYFYSRAWPISLLIAVAGILLWSAIQPHDYFTWFLEIFPVLIGFPVLAWLYPRRMRFTPMVYFLIALHAVILIVGGHYTYAHVPLGEWMRQAFDFSRNHYDRIGHFAQGFVPALIAREVLIRKTPLRPGGWMFVLVTSVCLAISACYEFVEWWVAVGTGSEAKAFLATQGDAFDTQADMFMALLGALAAQWLLGRWQLRQMRGVDAARAAD